MDKPTVKIEFSNDLVTEITIVDSEDEEFLLAKFLQIAGAMSNVILAKYGAEMAAQFAKHGAIATSLIMAVAGKTYLNGEDITKMGSERAVKDTNQTEPTKEYKEKKDDD